MNRYPLWKYLLILAVAALGILYAAPNLYAPDPAVQISGQSSAMTVGQGVLERAQKALDDAGIAYFGGEVQDKAVLLRLKSIEEQLPAKRAIQEALGHSEYVVALNLASTTPDWLANMGASPMKLGLDLAGGVHFLMEVDTNTIVKTNMEGYAQDVKAKLRAAKARYRSVELVDEREIVARFRSEELRDLAVSTMRKEFPQLQLTESGSGDNLIVRATLSDQEVKQLEDYAVTQNLTTLRNRVNELGVAEPIVQRQGRNRIVVELPGVQDTAEAKRIIGKTANLEFRMEARPDTLVTNKEYFEYRDERQRQMYGGAWLERKVIIKGDRVTDARVGYDESGFPQVNITLDSRGGELMHRATWKNVGRRMGTLFIESRFVPQARTDEQGNEVIVQQRTDDKKIISLATVQSALGRQFRITGLDSPAEAQELALLLRAGALAAPMYFVEERVIGPSLGADNIEVGVTSVQIGLLAVVICMLLFYRVFGLAANLALLVNMILLVAVMSIIGATLTLPGIAGIVLTVGMAVDANVLIFSRIREELRNGMSPQMAISAGFDNAYSTIVDANITTLIVAVILYAIGSGPVQGFAVTLSIGILTSMFSAIMGTRALINLFYGGRRVQKLWI
ncbi:protein translocase subunit SecD [Microbulbifer thermotolerans]|uniref:Protein translocase subunit SecD n=1 Tax=Microbulbifer thermotolerans TaxID=252514 RepID=A0A143HMU1_MICTH|nr:protein translocase subunit SecD [Microbulbifer thermotolerans]AMX03044.1 preprotein translocase subunit SecD [Microbulbifer thermotolerans]MCX2795720.1 protein translocase subunit SecD [Microbulbifer thermotolerans]MCX2802038.1 protein translocase subunit SecD [Microbulbifer thermotolerans]MCX2831424.1 protein translocase subunit SecD [Microbulbifer thermotolerans]